MTAVRAVFWATLLAIGLSFIRPETALWPRRLAAALAGAGRSVVPVVATTAVAGIIVGVVTLTGLGLKVSGVIVTLAGGSLRADGRSTPPSPCWVLGLAVPVTASYIIAAVMIAPALVQVGIPPTAAHMFIFYYAVLSGGQPADRAVAVRGRGADRRRSDEDDAAHLEVHAAGIRGAVHVHAERARRRGLLLQAPWPTCCGRSRWRRSAWRVSPPRGVRMDQAEANLLERAGMTIIGILLDRRQLADSCGRSGGLSPLSVRMCSYTAVRLEQQ